MDLALCEEADVRVHAPIRFRDGLHMRRPAESWLIHDPLDARVACAHGVNLHTGHLTAFGAFYRPKQ
jgi:hypothetical protein